MPQSPDNLPLTLYSAAQVRELDARLIAAGTPGFELMSRAAHAIWRALRRRWPDVGTLTVLAGRGNNAGDGYLVAALALRAGWQVRLLAVGDPLQLQGDAAQARDEAQAAGVTVQPWSECAELSGVVVDALLGTGLSGAVREPYAQVIRLLNASGLPVLAVDIPSGLCADSGQVLGVAVRAQLTVTLIGLKLGLFTGVAADWVGELVFDDLQAEPSLVAAQACVAQRLAGANVPRMAARPRTVHKGQLGHVLVVGGDRGLANQVRALGASASVWVVGPGLGQGAWGRSLLSLAAIADAPQVWDADALNLLAAAAVKMPAGGVITPHPGEAARLLGVSAAEVQADRPAAARALARRYQAVCVLKGAGSLVADPDGQLLLCDRGHPAMAGAGLGDVLAGLIGALLAQGVPAMAAASLAVWLHARAGERLAEQGCGLAASDLCAAIRQLLREQPVCPS